jgi:hypothetical protein
VAPGADDDGHHVLIDGRRWRATDPSIPDAFRHELVNGLMSARRDVGAARRAGHTAAESAARTRVQDAKVALGERGEPWWDPATPTGLRVRLLATVMTLLRSRRPESSICPSDAARSAGGAGWRSLVPVARDVADELAQAGLVVVTQGDDVVQANGAKGPVRIRRGPRFA